MMLPPAEIEQFEEDGTVPWEIWAIGAVFIVSVIAGVWSAA